jgi:putative DNA primase/helicase
MLGSDLWTVLVGDGDGEGLRRDRDPLFGEAVARYRGGESWRLDDADIAMLAAMQRQLLDASPGEERLEQWVKRQDQPFTALGAASSGLGLEIEDRKVEGIKQRVGKLLGEMGCTKTRPRDDEGHRQWLWKRPAKWGLVL